MNNKRNRMVRLIALILAILLALGTLSAALFTFAYGEEALPESNQCELTMEYLGEEQALRISQRLVYLNESGVTLDRVVFYAPANLFRRQSALPYDSDYLASAFPAGYLPGGIDLAGVYVNGAVCDWGFQGENEMFLRVACELAPGESCTFEFSYYLLLTENAAFLGASDSQWRLCNFYFSPASVDAGGEFILNGALSFTRYMDVPAMDFRASILLPEKLNLAATGSEEIALTKDGLAAWEIQAENARDFALVFGNNYREYTARTASGVQLRLLTEVKKTAGDVLDILQESIEICEAWFGPLPFGQIDVVQVDYGMDSLNHSACLWLDADVLKEGGWELEHAVRCFVAQQYFGCSAWARPVSDAWLSDALAEYTAYLILEEAEGHDAYLAAINEQLVPALQLTIPGGLTVTSDASLFTAYEYDIVVRCRGAAVFHELYSAMGREDLMEGLRLFRNMDADVRTEMDLAVSFEEASGSSWEKFLTDWLFNIGDYVNQNIDWLD